MHEETKGLFPDRTADRRGDHLDHRGHRNPELDAFEDGSESVFGRRISPNHQYRDGDLFDELSQRRICNWLGSPKSGYVFPATGGGGTPAVTYTSLATPQVQGQTGQNAYCSDQSGVLYYDGSGTACSNASTAL
jgi:hypothetical protein